MIKVTATARGFFGRLIEAGETFSIDNDDQFAESWMEKAGDDAQVQAPALQYGAKHHGGGSWVVINLATEDLASVVFKKGEKGEAEGLAKAEANRLNAGGTILLESSPAPVQEEGTGADLPDA